MKFTTIVTKCTAAVILMAAVGINESKADMMNFMNRQKNAYVAGGAAVTPKNQDSVCNTAKTATIGGKEHYQAWFCLQTAESVSDNQLFADQWKGANCKQYTAATYPKAWTTPFTPDMSPEGVQLTTMWAVKTTVLSANQLDPATYNPVCKSIAERLVFLQNQRACNACKYTTEQSAIQAANGQMPATCATSKACIAIANQPTSYTPPPMISQLTAD